jgi:multiple sugar transport system substrate-binding protein
MFKTGLHELATAWQLRRPALLLLAAVISALQAGCDSGSGSPTFIQFWAMGREGEIVKALLPEFERRNPDLRVRVQQIPWSAAHEKLLTAYAGEAMPDLFQLGNTWVPEFVALKAVEPLSGRIALSTVIARDDFFEGILETNKLSGELYGIPWYVDTRVLFYRKDLLARAGYTEPPRNWKAWLEAMSRLKHLGGNERYAILLPMNEWQMPIILALQQGAGLLRDNARYGAFRDEPFRRAFTFYLDFFRHQLAPAVGEAQIANLYQEFANGYFALYVTGPWNLGEFRRRLPEALQDSWATAALPSLDERYPGVSLAGGASLAMSRNSLHKTEAWRLIEFLAEPAQQAAFYRLTGDLPARKSAWENRVLAGDPRVSAFREQLECVASTPKIPEWERIASKVAQYAEKAVRGEMGEDAALTALDHDVDLILEKRRWLLERRHE